MLCVLCRDIKGMVELVAIRKWDGEIEEFDGVYITCPRCSGDEAAFEDEEEDAIPS